MICAAHAERAASSNGQVTMLEYRAMNSMTMFPVHLAIILQDRTVHQLFQMIPTDPSADSLTPAREGTWKEDLLSIAFSIFIGM